MIVRMAKIMIMGPLDLLMDTLSLVQQLGIMQVAEDLATEKVDDDLARTPQLLDRSSVLQHQFYTTLRNKIDELLQYLPPVEQAIPDEAPRIPVDSLAAVIKTHLAQSGSRQEMIVSHAREIDELSLYSSFLEVVTGVDTDREQHEDVSYIGFVLQPEDDLVALQESLDAETDGKVVIDSVHSGDGTLIGLAVTAAEFAGKVRFVLEQNKFEWIAEPAGLEAVSLSDRLAAVRARLDEKKQQQDVLLAEQKVFAGQWQKEYQRARHWLDRRLSLIKVTAAVVRTRMCFFIHGWLPISDLQVLGSELERKFGGRVVVEESELAEQDFAHVPTALHNPAYFEPFELFTRLLPMPPYASFDLTPFIGIFFPIFFGMMLGDVAYGIILLLLSLVLVRQFREKKNIRDAGRILFISSLYTIVFGFLYGEFLGTVGHRFLGMSPLYFDRQSSVIPMLLFAIAAGVFHVTLGLVLGVLASFRRKMKKEAVFRLVNILFILCACGVVLSFYTPSMETMRKPLLLTIAVFVPVLLLAGGLMAPLELLKNIGNIISYARIMAVGLTSVLLAYVANYMAGRLGSIWVGILVAFILHVFNLMLGIFAPTIHALRLHYVEFLTKFMEAGGKKFTPLGGKQ